MLFATYLCYRTKDTPDAVNESKFIALAVFLIVFISAAGLPIVLSLPLDPYLSQMIIGLCFFFATMGACGFYFGQKMFYLLQGADLNAQFKIVFPNGKLANSQSEKAKQSATLAQVPTRYLPVHLASCAPSLHRNVLYQSSLTQPTTLMRSLNTGATGR